MQFVKPKETELSKQAKKFERRKSKDMMMAKIKMLSERPDEEIDKDKPFKRAMKINGMKIPLEQMTQLMMVRDM